MSAVNMKPNEAPIPFYLFRWEIAIWYKLINRKASLSFKLPPKKAWIFKPVSWSSVLQTSIKNALNGLSQLSAEKSNIVTPIATKLIAIYGFLEI